MSKRESKLTPFGKLMRPARQVKGIKLSEISAATGIVGSGLCNMETGTAKPPLDERLDAWAKVLDLPPDKCRELAKASRDILRPRMSRVALVSELNTERARVQFARQMVRPMMATAQRAAETVSTTVEAIDATEVLDMHSIVAIGETLASTLAALEKLQETVQHLNTGLGEPVPLEVE